MLRRAGKRYGASCQRAQWVRALVLGMCSFTVRRLWHALLCLPGLSLGDQPVHQFEQLRAGRRALGVDHEVGAAGGDLEVEGRHQTAGSEVFADQRPVAQGYAIALGGDGQGQVEGVEVVPAPKFVEGGSGGQKPGFPVLVITGGVKQGVQRQVGGAGQWYGAIHQLLGAHGRELFIEQVVGDLGAAGLGAVDHRGVEFFPAKIHAILHGGGQLHRHVRALCLPAHKARQEPAHYAGGGLELQGFALCADLFDGLVDQDEDLLNARQ